MDTMTQYFDKAGEYINTEIAIFALTIGLLVTFLIALSVRRLPKTVAHAPAASSGSSQALFDSLQKQLREMSQHINDNKHAIENIEKQLPRTSLVRYNPFRDSGVGGNQSFSLATVDQNGNGSIITHLFSREMSRVQTKHITEWNSDTELSPEEKEALDKLKS